VLRAPGVWLDDAVTVPQLAMMTVMAARRHATSPLDRKFI
jgi:hypothetical protein